MVKKLQKMADKKNKASAAGAIPGLPAGLLDGQIAQTVKDSAQQIWAAGLGAFSKAQGEGGKVFDALVKEGMSLQKKTQSAAEEKLGAMASKMTGMAGEVGAKAGQQWDKLESIFEDRVASALQRLGVPTAKDIEALISRIDALSASVGGAKPAARKAAVKKQVAKRAAAKPVAKQASKPAAKARAKAVPVKKAAPARKRAAAKPAEAKA
jgi:poly(hydroxyalkanoate) granule-associated protein